MDKNWAFNKYELRDNTGNDLSAQLKTMSREAGAVGTNITNGFQNSSWVTAVTAKGGVLNTQTG